MVRRVIHVISKPLTHICNLLFAHGTFPDNLKIAKVIPIYKNGDHCHFIDSLPKAKGIYAMVMACVCVCVCTCVCVRV